MGFELYPEQLSTATNTSSHLGTWLTDGNKEINLRQEFYELLYGSTTEIAKGRPGILRRMRQDSNGDLITCPCVDEKTNEPDLDTICPYCWGDYYIWDEEWITYYKAIVSSHEGLVRKEQPHKPGISNIPFVFFYVEYDVLPTKKDRIIEVSLDEGGNISIPYNREAVYKIATPEAFRSDEGRIEYWRLAVIQDSVKSSWQV